MAIAKAIGSLMFLGAAIASASGRSATTGEVTQMEIQAQEFRVFLDQLHQRLSDEHKLRGAGTDVTADIAPFIPKGMDLGSAEAFLRAAGFEVGPRHGLNPPPEVNRSADWFGVVARLDPTRPALQRKDTLYITLMPRSPDDYSIVESVSATIFVSMP